VKATKTLVVTKSTIEITTIIEVKTIVKKSIITNYKLNFKFYIIKIVRIGFILLLFLYN
jgi:hypothetical protein